MSADLAEVAESSARGSFFLATGNMFSTAISAATTVIVARLLGADLYGVYTVSLAVPSLLISFGDFGIDQGLIRFSARFRSKGESESLTRMLRLGLICKALFGASVFCVCFFLSDYLATNLVARPNCGLYIRLASTSIVFQVVFNTASAVFVGFDRMEYSALLGNLNAIMKALVSPSLIILGFSVFGAITGFVVGYMVAGLFAVGFLFIKLYKPLITINRKENSNVNTNALKELLRYGFPLYVSLLLLSSTSQLQTVILANFTSDADIGNFKASLNFMTLLTVLALPVANALFSAFSKLDSDSRKARAFFAIATKYTSLLIVPISITVIILSKELVQLVYGGTYLLAPSFLSMQATLFFLVGFGSLVQSGFFNGLGETKITFQTNAVNFVVFLFLAPLLVQAHGVIGLIIALIFCNFAARIYGLYLAKSRFDASLDHKTVARIFMVATASGVPALLITSLTRFPSLVSIFVSGVVYFFTYITLIPLARIVDKRELDDLERITKNTRILSCLVKVTVRYVKEILARSKPD